MTAGQPGNRHLRPSPGFQDGQLVDPKVQSSRPSVGCLGSLGKIAIWHCSLTLEANSRTPKMDSWLAWLPGFWGQAQDASDRQLVNSLAWIWRPSLGHPVDLAAQHWRSSPRWTSGLLGSVVPQLKSRMLGMDTCQSSSTPWGQIQDTPNGSLVNTAAWQLRPTQGCPRLTSGWIGDPTSKAKAGMDNWSTQKHSIRGQVHDTRDRQLVNSKSGMLGKNCWSSGTLESMVNFGMPWKKSWSARQPGTQGK